MVFDVHRGSFGYPISQLEMVLISVLGIAIERLPDISSGLLSCRILNLGSSEYHLSAMNLSNAILTFTASTFQLANRSRSWTIYDLLQFFLVRFGVIYEPPSVNTSEFIFSQRNSDSFFTKIVFIYEATC